MRVVSYRGAGRRGVGFNSSLPNRITSVYSFDLYNGDTMGRVTEYVLARGRINRLDWLFGQIGVWATLAILYVPMDAWTNRPGTVVLATVTLWFATALCIRRYHDIGRSGWFTLVFAVPVLGPVFVIGELLFRRGQYGTNRFGPEPTDEEPVYHVVGGGDANSLSVNDVTTLNPVQLGGIVRIQSESEISELLRNSTGPFSIGGGRFSMGGQTAVEGTTQIDMRSYSGVVSFFPEEKRIRVKAGTRWCDIQKVIAPFGLSVMIMQTYANFTVGGSVSVNCHGRYVGRGPLILSIVSLRVALPDGCVLDVSPESEPEIFFAVVGCYGAIAVILEVELALDNNVRIQRYSKVLRVEHYLDHLRRDVLLTGKAVFHNADIYPRAFKRMRAVTWQTTERRVTESESLLALKHKYPVKQYFIWAFTTSSFGAWRRQYIYEPLFYLQNVVRWRNVEAGYDVAELEPRSRKRATYVLQEYFIPIDSYEPFLNQMRNILRNSKVDVLNISMRHAVADTGSVMAWARQETLAYVLYYRQGTTNDDWNEVGQWTRALIDAVLQHGGTYYLPYQPHATTDQFFKAYPRAKELFALKDFYDPSYKLRNSLWEKYYVANKEQL